MRDASRRAGHVAGFTLLELVITVALLALVIGTVALTSRASQRAYSTGATVAGLESLAQVAMERVVTELRVAGIETISPDPGGVGAGGIEYLQASFDGSDVVWGPLRWVGVELETGELDDGIDNNGNGLADEGRIVLVDGFGGPSARTRVLTHWVRELLEGEEPNGLDDNGNGLIDEPGFVIEREGETLILRLTLERRDAEGRLVQRTVRTSIRPRN